MGVFPTYVGVVLVKRLQDIELASIPHISGGDPVPADAYTVGQAYSPHV